MYKPLIFIAVVSMAAVSCTAPQMDPAAVQAKVDSIAAKRIEAITAQSIQECETRMATEVKSVTDSLVNAAQMAAAAQ
jgi:hypothetical protein